MTLTTTHFGVEIPSLGFGTWQLKADEAHHCVLEALNSGYRHIDTAQAYQNEEYVGRGLRDAGLPRDDYFLTTKIWMSEFRDGDLQRSAKSSLKRLDVDHLDLLLLHWPDPQIPMSETIGALNQAREEGLTKHIGVSNFNTAQLDEAIKLSEAPILVNQVEYHPFIDQTPMLEACKSHGSALTAYCPLAQGKVFDDPKRNLLQNVQYWPIRKPLRRSSADRTQGYRQQFESYLPVKNSQAEWLSNRPRCSIRKCLSMYLLGKVLEMIGPRDAHSNLDRLPYTRSPFPLVEMYLDYT
mgnify:CR=1 FL=1